MTYTPEKPPLPESTEQLRARIPGWGADLDPKDRPSFPRERFDPAATGAHWSFPERQRETYPRERSIEHAYVTPVFGTSCPPRGVSGVIRRYAYRYSEARAAHWLLLLGADRVDALESHLRSYLTLRPDPLLPTGLRSEGSHRGYSSRVGKGRADAGHHALDPVVAVAPALIAGGLAWFAVRAVRGAAARRA